MDWRRELMGGLSSEMNIDNYLTIEVLEDGLTASLSTNACEYCVDGDGNWKTLAANTATEAINTGQTLCFRGELTPNSSDGIGTFTISKKCNLKGNCMSLLFGDNAANNYSLSGKNYAFCELFQNCTNVVNVSSNFLPATTLTYFCYQRMFNGCTSLTTAPELPATTLTDYCYYAMFAGCTNLTTTPELLATTLATCCYDRMFANCTNLTTAPELPATILKSSCYQYMFYNCTSLTAAPELPATTLAASCYRYMFSGCTNLTTAPELPATKLAIDCYSYMFYGCTSLTTAPTALPATTLAASCYNSMFYNCTSLTTAPELPATTLIIGCYSNMFYGCTNLVTAPELPATTLVDLCYDWMFKGCTSLTAAPELPATTLAASCYRYMFSGCTSLTTAPELPATTLESDCYYYMFSGCTGLTTAPELPATTLVSDCYGGMFHSCASLTTAPELPATTLADGCYDYMFYGCTKLNYIKALFTTTPSTTYTSNWVNRVASIGTFVKNTDATWDVTGGHGIPSGWIVVNDGDALEFPLYLYTEKQDSSTYRIEPCKETLALVDYFWENAIEGSAEWDLFLPAGSVYIDGWELDVLTVFKWLPREADFEVYKNYDGIRMPRGRLYVNDYITANVTIYKGLLEIYDEG